MRGKTVPLYSGQTAFDTIKLKYRKHTILNKKFEILFLMMKRLVYYVYVALSRVKYLKVIAILQEFDKDILKQKFVEDYFIEITHLQELKSKQNLKD